MSHRTSHQHWRLRPAFLATAAAAAATALLLGGCSSGGSSSSSTSGSSAKEINIISWEGYHVDEWLAEYEAETGVKVNVQNTPSVAEMFAKVQADPDAFDLAMVTSGWVENYVDAGLVVPFDESRIENLGNTISELDWRAPMTYNDELYGLAYSWGTQPLVYNEDTVTEVPTSWESLWEPQYAGRVSMLDDATTQLPAIALALGVGDPYDMSDEEFEEFKAKLQELRPQLTHVAGSIQDQTNDFTSGQVDIGILYNMNTFVGATEAGTPLKIVIPEAGVAGWTDNYVITKAGEEKADIIYPFIDWTMSVPWQARMMGEIGYSGNLGLEVAQSEEAVAAGLTPELLARTEAKFAIDNPDFFSSVQMLRRVDNLEEWLSVWNDFKLSVGG